MKILKINRKNLKEAKRIIKKGGVVVFPTDTVYGLLADATNKSAVGKIFKIKKRSKTKSLPIFVKDLKAAKGVSEINLEDEKFLKKYWPGKVTAIFKRKKSNKLYGVAEKTIALRAPCYKPLNNLLAEEFFLTGTSANVSGNPASNDIKETVAQFRNGKNKPDLIIDAGKLKRSLPSTIIDLSLPKIKILREGEVKINVKTNRP